jgi:hypothetical protein
MEQLNSDMAAETSSYQMENIDAVSLPPPPPSYEQSTAITIQSTETTDTPNNPPPSYEKSTSVEKYKNFVRKVSESTPVRVTATAVPLSKLTGSQPKAVSEEVDERPINRWHLLVWMLLTLLPLTHIIMGIVYLIIYPQCNTTWYPAWILIDGISFILFLFTAYMVRDILTWSWRHGVLLVLAVFLFGWWAFASYVVWKQKLIEDDICYHPFYLTIFTVIAPVVVVSFTIAVMCPALCRLL